MNPKLISAAAAALLAMSGSAFAAMATATTDLNIRSGPGPQFDVIGVIGAGKGVDIQGCIEGSKWCTVAAKAGQGWVYSDYITSDFGGKQVSDRPAGELRNRRGYSSAGRRDRRDRHRRAGHRPGWRGRGCGRTSHHGAHLCHWAQDTADLSRRRDGGRCRPARRGRYPRDPRLSIPLRLPERPAGAGRPGAAVVYVLR